MKIDPHKHKETFLNWKEGVSKYGITGISKSNSDLFFRFIDNMENYYK